MLYPCDDEWCDQAATQRGGLCDDCAMAANPPSPVRRAPREFVPVNG